MKHDNPFLSAFEAAPSRQLLVAPDSRAIVPIVEPDEKTVKEIRLEVERMKRRNLEQAA